MNPDKTALIKYSQEFVTPYGTKLWVGVEQPIVEGVDEDLQFQSILQQVRNWGELATQTSYQGQSSPMSPPSAMDRIADIVIDRTPDSVKNKVLEEQMMAETCLRKEDGTGGLLSWKKIVENNPALQPAYDKRMKELQGE